MFSDEEIEKLKSKLLSRMEMIPECGCWIWMGALSSGYGHIYVNSKMEYVHRISYQVFIGSIPTGYDVLHRCDTPSCGNPYHLFTGTALYNSRDRDRKGRRIALCGEKHGGAKLNKEQVLFIRKSNISSSELAKQFKVDPSLIRGIRSGRFWRCELV